MASLTPLATSMLPSSSSSQVHSGSQRKLSPKLSKQSKQLTAGRQSQLTYWRNQFRLGGTEDNRKRFYLVRASVSAATGQIALRDAYKLLFTSFCNTWS